MAGASAGAALPTEDGVWTPYTTIPVTLLPLPDDLGRGGVGLAASVSSLIACVNSNGSAGLSAGLANVNVLVDVGSDFFSETSSCKFSLKSRVKSIVCVSGESLL